MEDKLEKLAKAVQKLAGEVESLKQMMSGDGSTATLAEDELKKIGGKLDAILGNLALQEEDSLDQFISHLEAGKLSEEEAEKLDWIFDIADAKYREKGKKLVVMDLGPVPMEEYTLDVGGKPYRITWYPEEVPGAVKSEILNLWYKAEPVEE